MSKPGDISRDELDVWLSENCGTGLPHGEAIDERSMLHGLAYVLRQIESTNSYRPHIGQCTAAKSALRLALDHFAASAIRKQRAG